MLEKIGPYKFISVLGRGGMGTVFKGEHEETGELHAVKVLAPNYSQESHFRARFESEIQALIKLDHPNIVRLISFGQESGNLFFAMELVDGKSLFEVQRSGHRFSPPQCLSIAKDVCSGLRHAHDRGIIHRDLKPGNLMLNKDRVVKIADFGIAKSFGSSQNTGNNILGTMDFMSPEQAKGEMVTAKSDIYSLGTVLFTLLSGKPPFSGNSIEESFRNLTRVPPPNISSIVPDIPHEVDLLIRRMMEKKPEKRIATAQAALHQINQAQQLLKNYSEAKTAQHSRQQTGGKTTSDVGSKKSNAENLSGDKSNSEKTNVEKTELNTDVSFKTSAEGGNGSSHQPKTSAGGFTQRVVKADKTRSGELHATSIASESQSDLGDGGDDFVLEESVESTEPVELDYFNTVTDEEREISADQDDLHQSHGVGWLLAGLLTVIAVAAVGTWFATRSPSADELYAQIDEFRSNPESVVEQSNQFISLYPQDDRVDEVQEINEIGKSIDFYHDLVNKLSVRARIPGESRMTEIEDQFYDIVRLADDDMKSATAKMAAFVTVHGGNDGLDSRDADCVAAAKGFRLKHKTGNVSQVKQRIEAIQATVLRAQQMDSSSEAMKVYRSLIQLHHDQNWGDQDAVRIDLLTGIKQRMKDLAKEME